VIAEEQLMTVAEFGRRIGLPRATAYRRVAAGLVDVVNVGTARQARLRITEVALRKYVEANLIKGRRAA
jgi:hypothetical protein